MSPSASRRRCPASPSRGALARRPRPKGGPPPLTPPSTPPPFPAPSGPAHQKITLYAGGALVVLIVIVIIALTSGARARALAYVPKGQTVVQVIDTRRFFRGPVHQVLVAAGHPVIERFEEFEKPWNISLRRHVALLTNADDSTILVGRLRPDRMRRAFKEALEKGEREINRGRQTPVKLQIQEDEVEGHRYSYCQQEGIDQAIATIGSSVVCLGDKMSVRRILKVRAGLTDCVLDDAAFAAAYAPDLARRAFLHRLEKPNGNVLARTLKDILGEAAEGVTAAFFAVAATDEAVELTIRFVARSPGAAQKLKAQLFSEGALEKLRAVLGTDAMPSIARAESIVTLESSVPLGTFEHTVAKDKKGQVNAKNLVLTLLAG